MIAERTKAGLAAARDRGRMGGRPRKIDKATLQMAATEWQTKTLSPQTSQKALHMTTTTLYAYVNGDGSLKTSIA